MLLLAKSTGLIITFCIVGVIIIVALIFLLIYLNLLKKKRKIENDANSYYLKIIEAMGGIDNILQVSAHYSRLSFVLNDKKLIDESLIEGIGVIKTSQKIILVVGEKALEFEKAILKEKEK